ncbi:MAG: hypothetical protein WBL31_09045, partial [Ilumatobacteraceae bacterium]
VADGSGDGTGIERGHICLLELFDDLRHRHVFILTRGSHRDDEKTVPDGGGDSRCGGSVFSSDPGCL